ncbi:MAG: hypothetical protein ACFB4J_12905 [Elainellaceae cyanobacterium]
MHPIETLPNPQLRADGVMTEAFRQQGLTTFHDACRWAKALPYAANTNSEDSLILFEEGCGNCTTKHGAIARLAAEHELPVRKHLGFYRLNDEIVTGVSALLAPHGLDFIPQSHCFLVYEDCWVDLTEGNCNGKNKTIEDYDFVVEVAPDLTRQQQQNYYLTYLQRYRTFTPQLAALSDGAVLDLLTACDRQLKYQCSIMAGALSSVG